jgi:hypothetical protein
VDGFAVLVAEPVGVFLPADGWPHLKSVCDQRGDGRCTNPGGRPGDDY